MSPVPLQPRAISSICRTVPDLVSATAFYGEALGFVPDGAPQRRAPDAAALLGAAAAVITVQRLRLGAQRLDLLAFDPPGRPYPADSTSSDLWFQHCAIVVGDMAAAFAQLQSFAITPITQGGPQRLPPEAGSVTAFKFRDPFGHPLELLSFPYGSGDPAWQVPRTRGLFLGIDHSAIAVADAGVSTAFYRERLGFRIGGRSKNIGPAQGRLDAVPADDVDVVALMPQSAPPHFELLGYRAGSRRSRPAGRGPADIAVTRTLIDVADFASLAIPDDADCRGGSWNGVAARALRDPDGHALILQQKP